MTGTAVEATLARETTLDVNDVRRLADVAYRIDDLAAAVSSGGFRAIGMIVAPCSMRSLGEIVHGITSNLLTRAADVVLEERRKLVLVAREMPLPAIYPRNVLTRGMLDLLASIRQCQVLELTERCRFTATATPRPQPA